MSTFTNKTGLEILEFIDRLKINYGRNNLSKMVWHNFGELSIYQSKDLISQLIEQDYLKEMNVGIGFAMMIVALTDKGKDAVNNKKEINLDFQRYYSTKFKSAKDIGVVDKDVLQEYYDIRRELFELQDREEELKNTIKKAMIEKNTSEIHSEIMDLYCKKVIRVNYPKEKIERFVPSSIIEKIKTVNESIVLTAKLKNLRREDDGKSNSDENNTAGH